MELTRRERVRRAIYGEKLDRFPTQYDFTSAMAVKVAAYWGMEVEDLPERLDNHLEDVWLEDTLYWDKTKGLRYDIWGTGWRPPDWLPCVFPLKDLDQLNQYAFPDPTDRRLYRAVEAAVRRRRGGRFILGDHGCTLFERAWALRGFEAFLVEMLVERERVEKLLDRITEFQIEVAKRFVTLGVDGGYTGDDYGSQHGLLFSPELWRDLFKPRLERIWRVYREAGLPVFHHSCGDVTSIVGDMVEIGLNVLSPVQPEAIPLSDLIRDFGDQLCFWGGISTQRALPLGAPCEVRAEVRESIEILGCKGRYIIAPAHALLPDIPMANFEALVETVEEMKWLS